MDLSYEIKYSDRKTVNISVERDRKVVVRAPNGLSEQKIYELVEQKKFWLYEKVNHFQKYPKEPKTKEFVSGESIMYIGKNYKLDIVPEQFEDVKFSNKFSISRTNHARASELLKQWYITKAKEKIIQKAKFYSKNLGVKFNQVKIVDNKYRWASCTLNDNINFSWRIIKAPNFVIDYLIVHELTHLLEANHTQHFWNIISIQIPKYPKAKEWLKVNGSILEEDL